METVMKSFLKSTRLSLKRLDEYKILRVVSGNEACDLDSAVSALVYGLLLHKESKTDDNSGVLVIPILNIPHSELSLKSEVIFWFKKNEVPLELLIFRDQVDLKSFHASGKLELILVDHHVLPLGSDDLRPAVTEVIDHRPQQQGWEWTGRKVNMMIVGSCCTLVAKEVISRDSDILTQQVVMLLYGTIVLDTACLSVDAGRTEPLDHEIVLELEDKFDIIVDRDEVFRILLKARSDVTGLTSSQLLIRDMKVVDKVPISGLPLLVQEYVKLCDAENALRDMCVSMATPVAVLMGMCVCGHTITRDIGVFSASEPTISQKLVEYLLEDGTLQLQPLTKEITYVFGMTLFQQSNVKASRKQALPLIKAALASIEDWDTN